MQGGRRLWGWWLATRGGGGCMAAGELAGRRTSVGAGGEHGVVLEERADAGEIQLVNLWVKTESQTGWEVEKNSNSFRGLLLITGTSGN